MMLGCVHILKKVPTSSVCRAPASSPVTGFHGTSSSYKATWLKRTSRAHHHTWITGHPHRIAFNNTSASLSSANSVGNASSSQQACSLGTTAGAGAGASAHVPSGTLMDFAGNSRFLANHLARFSTLSAVSSASSPSPSSPAAFSPVSSQQQPQGSSKTRASPSQDADPSSGSGSSSAQTKFGTSATTASPSTDDKEDDAWEVNESFTGHSGSSRSITTSDSRINPQKPDETELPARATSGSSASTDQDDTQDTLRHNHHHSDDDSPTTLRPSLSSFKDAASIEKSWRRTSDQLSQSASSSPSSSSSTGSTAGTTLSRSGGQNQAGNLDLSSSTLVQQMLFGDRRPSSSETEEANKTKGDQTSADATNVEGKDDDPHLHTKGGSSSPLQDALFSRDRIRHEDDKDSSMDRDDGSGDIEDDQLKRR
ncbi:hypothetical protein BGZ73_008620 [Actinomortierella ambigua]|nr:hypothetical protein BGZ73_008620 [Actinomortierella ambigua]